jgi:hypothetical protein
MMEQYYSNRPYLYHERAWQKNSHQGTGKHTENEEMAGKVNNHTL